MGKEKNILNKEEKAEIVSDVKEAFNKAKKDKKITYNNVKPIKRPKSLVFITAIIVLVIACTGIYWYLANNPKTIFIRSIDVVFETLNNNVPSHKSTMVKGNVDIDYELKGENNYEQLNKYKFKIDYDLDTLKNISKSNINIIFDNNPLSDITIYKNKNELYLSSEELEDEYINLDNREVLTYDDKHVKFILKSLNDAILNSLEGQRFSSSEVELVINEKKLKTYKASLNLNKENIITVIDNIDSILKEDTRFINSYSKTFNLEKENVITHFKNKISNLKTKLKVADDLTINIYTNGVEHEFVRLEFIENKQGKLDTYNITQTAKNKYAYLIDKQSQSKKIEGTLNIKEEKNGKKTYDWTIVKTNYNKVVLDAAFKIKLTEKETDNVKQETIKDAPKYSLLPPEYQNVVNTKLLPIKNITSIIENK